MPEITMCSNQECISAEFCERFTAKKRKKQSTAFFCGNYPGWQTCQDYIPNEKAQTFSILAGNNSVLTNDADFLNKAEIDSLLNLLSIVTLPKQ